MSAQTAANGSSARVGRDLRDRPTDRGRIGVRGDHGVVGRRRPPHPGRHLRAERLRIGAPRPERLDAVLGRLPREERHQERRARGVRVLVAPDVDTLGARAVERLEQQRALPLVLRTERLAVRDLHARAGATTDVDRFVERRAEPLALVAHVGGVRAPPPGRDPRERHDLVGLGVHRRDVDQPGREPDRPGTERLFRQRAHGGERVVRELPARAVRGQSKRPVADERRDVVGRAGGLDAVEVVGERSRRDRDAGKQVAPRFLDVGGGRVVQRCHGESAIAHDLGGHALQQLERLRLGHHRHGVGVRMRVDEPRRDEPPLGGDRPRCRSDVVPHRDHTTRLDRDVGSHAGRAQPVVDDATGDDQIVHHR